MKSSHQKLALSLSVLSLSLLTACTNTSNHTPIQKTITVIQGNASSWASSQPIAEVQKAQPTPKIESHVIDDRPTHQPITPKAVAEHPTTFNDWKEDFIHRAIAKGYGANMVHALMDGANFNQRIVDLDRSQAEFTKMPWEYVSSAASASRVNQGRAKLAQYPTTFNHAELTYGVPKQIVAAIWGMESSFGAATGNTDLVNALSTLAYDGRRREFAENQLFAMLHMLNRGDVESSQFKGSWAGGMGHTQFIPSTWVKEGLDGNGDGHINPWSVGDALNSTASYLKNAGWIAGLAPYYEIRLPNNFNYELLNTKQTLDTWRNLGLSSVVAEDFGGSVLAELWLPAGINGPALLLTPNFEVIRVYNNSTSYALGVSLLAKRLSGNGGLVASWPTHERPLSRSQVERLQNKLNEQGFDAGGVDGVVGANTRRAFARWQSANGRIPDGFISQYSTKDLIW